MNKLLYFLLIITLLCECTTHKNKYQLSKKKTKALIALSRNQIKDSILVNPLYLTEPTSGSTKINYTSLNCFYVTDRNILINNARPTFGNERSELHYGNYNISIPKTHEIGQIEEPSLLKLELNEDPNKHISFLTINSFNKELFFKELKQGLDYSQQSNAVIFIHGYNASFNIAAKRTAQLYYDFGLKGIPILYSWPSQNNPLKYITDENNSEWSAVNFRLFLNDFLAKSKVENLYLIAHSMGNKLLIDALADLLKEPNFDKKRIKEIILVAPDMDEAIFKRDYAPHITMQGIPLTLYVSSNDNALLASKVVHGNKRVGDASNKPMIIRGIETIDATNVNTDILGHSYISNSRSVADDIFYLINNSLRADKRRLSKRSVTDGIYWEFNPK